MKRVLVACRGEVARRLIRQLGGQGIETVSVFMEQEAEHPWVDEADYPTYLMGREPESTYLDARRLVSAALDAGCEAVHPGCNLLAGRFDFVDMANLSNVAVIGADGPPMLQLTDRLKLRDLARRVGVPLVPASEVLAADDDGQVSAAQLGFPVFVKSVAIAAWRRADDPSQLGDAVAAIRKLGDTLARDARVYLERAVTGARQVGTLVAADRAGHFVALGETDASLKAGGMSWIEEAGPGLVPPALHARLQEKALALAKAVEWVGLVRFNWAILPDGGWYLTGASCRLTQGYRLVEAVQGVDLIQTQIDVQQGEPLRWEGADPEATRFGVQVRLVHGDAALGGSREPGVLEALSFPEEDDLWVDCAFEAGNELDADTEPVIAKLTVTAPTRQAALVRARAALEATVVEGVQTNREQLIAFLADPRVWSGTYDDATLDDLVAAWPDAKD